MIFNDLCPARFYANFDSRSARLQGKKPGAVCRLQTPLQSGSVISKPLLVLQGWLRNEGLIYSQQKCTASFRLDKPYPLICNQSTNKLSRASIIRGSERVEPSRVAAAAAAATRTVHLCKYSSSPRYALQRRPK